MNFKPLLSLYLILSLGDAAATSFFNAQLQLQTTNGGAFVTGKIVFSNKDELVGVWNNLSRARLMKCNPNCEVVNSFPVSGTLVLSAKSTYRIIFGGRYSVGQKVKLVFKFKRALLEEQFAITKAGN